MPRLWSQTIEAHRRDVRDAILQAAAELVDERGLLSVTMSEIAQRTGIGRATLYKYFDDVETVLVAWHDRHVQAHLDELAAIAGQPGDPGERLEAVLERYAAIVHQRHSADMSALLHRDEHMAATEQRLHAFVTVLVAEGAAAGVVRDDVAPVELANFCLHALNAAGTAPSKAAVRRLVEITVRAVRST